MGTFWWQLWGRIVSRSPPTGGLAYICRLSPLTFRRFTKSTMSSSRCLWPHYRCASLVNLPILFGPYFCQPVLVGFGDEGKPFITHCSFHWGKSEKRSICFKF